MKQAICFLMLLLACTTYGQREASNWFFGANAGLDFNSGAPQILNGGQLNTVEGCETFSDVNGNLLFYTDGKTVWNRNHGIMPNGTGLKGSFSTTQSALVVPNPVIEDIFYVFTPDDALAYNGEGGSNGFNYSVIDMGLDGGNGDVLIKNIDLLENASENVTAVIGPDGISYWVVTHYQNQFYSYLVDGTGVNEEPVISILGPTVTGGDNIRGSIKISPNGKKLAIANTIIEPEYTSSLHLFDFDNITGVVSNAIQIPSKRLYYGVEFSSNSSKLYSSGLAIDDTVGDVDVGSLEIVQFDLNDFDIPASEYLVGTYPSTLAGNVSGALQMGIDKKIYHAVPGEKLSVIRTPNLKGIDCDFRLFEVDLGDNALSTYGLPPFIQSFFETIVTIENFCEGEATTFTTDSSADIASISWDFGDPSSGSDNSSSDLNPTHIFSAYGVYTVTIDVDFISGPSKKYIEFVEIAESPNVTNSIELVQCDVDGLDDGLSIFNLSESISLFSNGNEDINALFFISMDDAIANINQLSSESYENTSNGQIIYARAFENAECYTFVQIELTVKAMSDLGTYAAAQICDIGNSLLVFTVDISDVYEYIANDFPNNDGISIFTSESNALLEVEPLALEKYQIGPFDEWAFYFRLENNNACDFMGKLPLDIISRPEFEDTVNLKLCGNGTVLEAPEGFLTYSWSTGENAQSITVNEVGNYSVDFSVDNCSYTQHFILEESSDLKINEIEVWDFRDNNEVIVHAETENSEILYSIDDGFTYQTVNSFKNLKPGIYGISVTDNCKTIDSSVVVGGLNSFFSPNNDGINDIWTLANAEFFPNFEISIFDRFGQLISTFKDGQEGWNGTYNNQLMPSTDYWYKLKLENGRTVNGHFALKR
ncbi:gliding motility-associated-like protein [Saonia flava]|uniref:Gliding motility-associated-like protein n=1 Tax=Saonia flava TaxID=523696 RepID=A0A846QYR3_9FLAO|nr:T9SS type B sorting domain-containing protein [Saonia flava]NJB72060.1 gliding motility-associated-like protein [Saonia flava]